MTMEPEYSQIYVGDLEPEIDEKKLYDHCQKVFPKVEIFSIRVVRDWQTFVSLRYAYVNLTKKEDAVKFISLMNHTVIENTKNELRVAWKQPAQQRGPTDANLFVNKLNKMVNSAKIDELFAKYAPILSSKVVPYADSAKAYVQLESAEKAQAAINDLNGQNAFGTPIMVAIFMKKSERRDKYTNLYVKNFPEGTTLEKLAEVFSLYGKVTSAYIGSEKSGMEEDGVTPKLIPKVKVNEDGTRTLYGFVNFETHEQAAKAQTALNGSIFPGTSEYTIEVTRAMKKEERKRSLFEMGSDCCLYVGSIPKDVRKDELEMQFSTPAHKATYLNYPDKIGKTGFRFAYVYYANRAEADLARNALHGKTIRNTSIRVDFYKTRAQLQAENDLRKQRPMQMPGNYFQYGAPYGAAPTFQQPQQFRNNNKKKNPMQPRNPTRPRGNFGQQGNYPQPAVNNFTQPGASPVGQTPAPLVSQPMRSPAKIEPISDAEFAAMSDEDKHEAFGERIYNYMSEAHPESYAGKITGMVLETFKGNFAQLNTIIANGSIITKINEAIAVYQEHEKKN